MPASTEDVPQGATGSEPRRAGRELLLEGVFRPAANALVPLLEGARIPPPVVVLANALTGLAGALLLARGELVAAALLLQLKTLLDNADGQLARATGRVTLAGRYLDTVADLVVNATIFLALGYVTGQPVLAVAGFVALTFVLAVDFNVTELYREANGMANPVPQATGNPAESVLSTIYGALFAPVDRAMRRLVARRLGTGVAYDHLTVTVLANLGLTTQLAVLGLCLLLGAPAAYPWIAIGCLVPIALLHARAERGAGLRRRRAA